ncbi:MAG: TIGR04168 family protein, partial [Cyanobacteria bacterium P01_D01_bin.115]
MTDTSMQDRALRIAVIGDVHDQWDEADISALHSLEIDLALFVGDFGNEAVAVVRSIAGLSLPKAAIFGNHDAWYTATPWGRKKCPYDRATEDWVQLQMELLGDADVGYGKRDFPQLGLTVIGGRPFSWGGSEWKYEAFYRDRYGIHNFAESLARIKQAVDDAAFDTLIFMGHCGPTGLGDTPESPCGRDWPPIGGDFGDPDLAAAIAYAQQQGKTVPLVTFGHMHHALRHRQDRQR